MWVALGRFFSLSSNSALHFMRHKIKRIVSVFWLYFNAGKQISVATEPTSVTLAMVRGKKDHNF